MISKALASGYLWDRVRVSGGAYGVYSEFDSHSGMFTYASCVSNPKMDPKPYIY